MQYCTHICLAIICYRCFNVGMIGQINSGMEPVERCQSTSFHRTGHCPCFVQRRCLGNSLPGLIWMRNQWKGEQHLIQKEAWKEIWYFLSSFTKCFGWIFLVILYLRLSGWNKEPSRWLGQVVKPFVCLVGPWNRLQCDPGPKHSPTRIGSRAKPNHANEMIPCYTVFTSWRVPVSIQWVVRTCSALFGHFVWHLFAPAIILGFVLGVWSWNHLKLPRATTERSFLLMWPLKDNSANISS